MKLHVLQGPSWRLGPEPPCMRHCVLLSSSALAGTLPSSTAPLCTPHNVSCRSHHWHIGWHTGLDSPSVPLSDPPFQRLACVTFCSESMCQGDCVSGGKKKTAGHGTGRSRVVMTIDTVMADHMHCDKSVPSHKYGMHVLPNRLTCDLQLVFIHEPKLWTSMGGACT